MYKSCWWECNKIQREMGRFSESIDSGERFCTTIRRQIGLINSLLHWLIQVSQSCEDMLISCIYGGSEYNCTDLFVTVLTDEGLCCTFNGVNKRFIAKPNIKSAIIFQEYLVVSEFYVSILKQLCQSNWIRRCRKYVEIGWFLIYSHEQYHIFRMSMKLRL